MKIQDIRATTVTVPLEAPLVEIESVFRAMKSYLVGHDPARLEEMRFKIANPTTSLYNNRTQVLAALEFACLDLLGQSWGVPVHAILGGKLRDLKARFGFTTHKMKAGVFPPDYELDAYRALAQEFPNDRVRFDPNGALSTEEAIRFSRHIEDLNNDYLEDPVFGLNGMRRTRQMTRVPLATNTVVVNFEQLSANVLHPAVDVILLDTTFWGGIRACVKAAGVCETLQYMPHLGAVIPNLTFAADAHYHDLVDDIIEGGPMRYENGCIGVPDAPGLGVRLNRDKLRQYSELYRELDGYPYDQDPLRPGSAPLVPNDRWVDPDDARTPALDRTNGA